jgi:type VI secretion system protein ImpM
MNGTLGIMGKHPGFGDFIRARVDEPRAKWLEDWLNPTLHSMREGAGDHWDQLWDQGQVLRFWIGRAVAGQTLAGVFMPSRDKVGRRYPLIVLGQGMALSAPVIDPDQTYYSQIEAHLAQVQPGQGGESLLEGLDTGVAGETDQDQASGPLIWAHHPEGDLQALLGSAGPVDQERATLNRSYWWATGGPGRSATWLACAGLPAAESLAWCIAGVPAPVGGI